MSKANTLGRNRVGTESTAAVRGLDLLGNQLTRAIRIVFKGRRRSALGRMLGLSCLAMLASIALARAGVDVHIQIGAQTATVAVDGATVAVWPVSTARRGYRTPRGSFRPYRLERMHYSSIYENAPMPYSTFFYGGFAIHGTMEVRNLGRPVSHGCVRLSPDNARVLYDLIRSYGLGSTSIVISD